MIGIAALITCRLTKNRRRDPFKNAIQAENDYPALKLIKLCINTWKCTVLEQVVETRLTTGGIPRKENTRKTFDGGTMQKNYWVLGMFTLSK